MFRIGLQYNNYPELRNIIDKVNDAEYLIIKNECSFYLKIINKAKKIFNIKEVWSTKKIYSFSVKFDEKIVFFHLFNSIFYGRNNWGVTFETIVPYHEENKIAKFLRGEVVYFKNDRSVKKIFNSNCKFIIAISQNAYNLQCEYLKNFPLYKDFIVKKMHVLHPPQMVLLEKYQKPNVLDEVSFMFIGREFLCKGGIEIIRVFNKIKAVYPNFRLTLVGDFYKTNGRCLLSENEFEELLLIVENNKDRIRHFNSLPNDKVLKMMVEDCHVGLLPTHADTYGYSVLEFQSAGCPVISTNIRALPEINNDECGWLIDVAKSHLGEPLTETEVELKGMQETIENQLLTIISAIMNDPSSIKPKALKSIERIKENHSVLNYSKKMAEIYNQSIGTEISFKN